MVNQRIKNWNPIIIYLKEWYALIPNIIYNIIGYNYGPYYRPHSYNYYNYNYSRIRPYNDTRIRHSNSMYLSTFGIRSNKVKVNNSVIKRSGGVKKKNEN